MSGAHLECILMTSGTTYGCTAEVGRSAVRRDHRDRCVRTRHNTPCPDSFCTLRSGGEECDSSTRRRARSKRAVASYNGGRNTYPGRNGSKGKPSTGVAGYGYRVAT